MEIKPKVSNHSIEGDFWIREISDWILKNSHSQKVVIFNGNNGKRSEEPWWLTFCPLPAKSGQTFRRSQTSPNKTSYFLLLCSFGLSLYVCLSLCLCLSSLKCKVALEKVGVKSSQEDCGGRGVKCNIPVHFLLHLKCKQRNKTKQNPPLRGESGKMPILHG